MFINDPLPGLTKVSLLEALREKTQAITAELLLPSRPQKSGEEKADTHVTVYIGRLPDMKQSAKKAPYILHQIVNSAHRQEPGELLQSKAIVRSICCVYCDDEQEGTLTLINLMERIRIAILRNPLIGDNQFECDFHEGLEDLVYPDDTYPYYMGEIISTWSLPAVKREGVRSLWE